jgi:catechol O-methyltransferase
LLFVHQQVKNLLSTEKQSPVESNVNWSPTAVLLAIDQFCMERHWMMHVGPQKGCILQDFLKEQIQKHVEQYQHQRLYTVVELGTYCGYSTIRIVDTLLRYTTNFHVYTIDVNAETQNVAKKLIALAGLQKYVTFVLRQTSSIGVPNEPISFVQQLTNAMLVGTHEATADTDEQIRNASTSSAQSGMINFLFVDHAKELYLSDVQELEDGRVIRRGTAIAADNVVFFQLTDYCQYMASLQTKGIVQSKLVTDGLFLEYANFSNSVTFDSTPSMAVEDLRDGLGMWKILLCYL